MDIVRLLFILCMCRETVCNTDMCLCFQEILSKSANPFSYFKVLIRPLEQHLRSDVWLTVHRNSVWIRKTN